MKRVLNNILKSIFVPIIISVLFGYICGKFVYKTYKEDIYGDLTSSKLYLVEYGEYATYDNMREENSNNNYVYYKDDNVYKTVVGITKNYDNVDKIKKLYSKDVKVEEYYVSTEFLDSKQDEYDNILSQTEDVYEVKEIVDNILNLYRSDDSIRLVSIN